MKRKLKEWKAEIATAKSAWIAAKKANKTADEIAAAYKAVTKLQPVIDEAEASGAKDDDEIEVKSEHEGKGPDGASIEMDDLKAMVATTVAEAIKKSLPDKAQQDQVTSETIKAAIETALAKHGKAQSKEVALTDVKGIISDTIKEQMDALKKSSKQAFSTDSENDEGKHIVTVELGNSLTKGNLPLHMKQLLNVMMKRAINHEVPDAMVARGKLLGDRMVAKYSSAIRGHKAMTSVGVGIGDEWVPTDLSSELQRRFYATSDLAAIISAREIDMPTQPYEYPLVTTRPVFYLETTENVEATPSNIGTSKVTLNAKKMMGRVDFSYELEEDSIIPILPMVQELLSAAAADAYESAIINGDTTAVHMDSDTQAVPKAAERAFDGLRKYAKDVAGLWVDLSTGGLTEANLRSMKKRMGKYGARPRDLIWLVGPGAINDMMGITNVTTIEKYGPRATLVTGELTSFLGIPIVVSERMREDLNALGVYDGVTTTRGGILLVSLSNFLAGRRREFTVEVDRDIKTQTHFVVASFRRAFTPIEAPSATIQTVVGAYNYAA